MNSAESSKIQQQAWPGVGLKYIGLVLVLLGAGLWMQGGYIYLKAELGQFLIDRAWQQRLETGRDYKPWFWADTWPVARMQIPALGITQTVLASDSGQALAFGPGHTTASAQPGAFGVVLISGHRDTHFGFLQDLRGGEEIILQNGEGRHTTYRVSSTQIVNQDVLITPSKHLRSLMLVTCWPIDSSAPNPQQRFIVHAQPVGESPGIQG